MRCLDAASIPLYLDLSAHIDLSRQEITAASLSDILRVLLLHEYGGVWVDATTLCVAPLDNWLDQAAQTGFFAFANPAEDREIASWFLAARPADPLLGRWASRTLAYWQGRRSSPDYFWFHHLFGELIDTDPAAFARWRATPRISADGPHSAQWAGLLEDCASVRQKVDWSAPVFKLTHRLSQPGIPAQSLLGYLLPTSPPPRQRRKPEPERLFLARSCVSAPRTLAIISRSSRPGC